jgi:hypothetical protein
MEIKSILSDMKPFINQTDEIPVIMVGDFNTHSHLDVSEKEASKLPVTQEVANIGYLYNSEKLDHHPVFWPSDHASVVSYFYFDLN